MKLALMILAPVCIGVAGQILLKIGMGQIGAFSMLSRGIVLQYLRIFFNPYVFAGLSAYFLSTVFWLYLISRVPLSLAYPMLSLGYIVIALISWIVFKEKISLINWAGIFLIMLGVSLVAQGRI